MPHELDADVFDTMELSCLAYKGIGAGAFFDDGMLPLCWTGHLAESGAIRGVGTLRPFGIDEGQSDRAVGSINARKGRDVYARVTWREYTKELGIVRKSA